MWTTETHDPSFRRRVVRWDTRWLGLISFSISSTMFRESAGRIGTKHGTTQGKDKHWRKSRPCIDTDVLTKARCSEDNKHAGNEREPLVKTFRSHYHT